MDRSQSQRPSRSAATVAAPTGDANASCGSATNTGDASSAPLGSAAPIQLCGNAINALNPSAAAACATSKNSATSGAGPLGAAVPLLACGNAVGASANAAVAGTCAKASNTGAGPLSVPALICGNVIGALTGTNETCATATNSGGGTDILPIKNCATAASVLGNIDGNCPTDTSVPSNPNDPNNTSNDAANDSQTDSLPAQSLDGALAFTGANMGAALQIALQTLLIGCAILVRGRRVARVENSITEYGKSPPARKPEFAIANSGFRLFASAQLHVRAIRATILSAGIG
jgi:hypothetical protein